MRIVRQCVIATSGIHSYTFDGWLSTLFILVKYQTDLNVCGDFRADRLTDYDVELIFKQFN